MYSQMLSKLKQSTPQPEIGEVVTVLAGNNAGQVIANTQGKYVLADRIYNRSDYPDLYARIGSVGASTFTPRTSGTTSTINALTYGNGTYIYGGNGGVLRTSTDGITWTAKTSGTTSSIVSLAYGNGTFVYAVGTTSYRTSTDNGETWTARTSPQNVVRITYNAGIFFAAGSSAAMTSTDAITWTTLTSSGVVNNVGSVEYGNGIYLVGSIGGSPSYSTNGTTWTTPTITPAIGSQYTILYHNGLFIVGTQGGSGASIRTTTNGATWVERSSIIGNVRSISYGNGIYIAVANIGGLASSTDGMTWTARITGTTTGLLASVYGNGRYIIAGDSGNIFSSDTAINPEYSTTYNATTQFYVPPFTRGSRFYTLASYGSNSTPTFVNYVRAK